MSDFKIRTENFRSEEILKYFVENPEDRIIVEKLKSETPVVLVGGRGVGKSFLMRVAEAELEQRFEEYRVLPVYLTLTQGSLLHAGNDHQFHFWMMARLCSAIVRKFKKKGILISKELLSPLGGSSDIKEDRSYLEKIIEEFEESWKNPGAIVAIDAVPNIDSFRSAIEDICDEANIKTIAVFFDEAAHVLRPEQQRQFFSLFRDLNTPYFVCNATVYPGVTSFGKYFQPIHDAVFLNLDRDPLSASYVENMRRIVEKQADSKLLANIAKNGGNFALLAYAANGNPRILLKTVSRAKSMSSSDINTILREFYRSDIWQEHSLLAEKYKGYKPIIDWGRNFIEDIVLSEIKLKNDNYQENDKKTSCFFWIHRDAPERVRNALSLLSYTGIVSLHSEGIKATRKEIGTRYSVNLGCLLALEGKPAATGLTIIKNITIKRMTEFGSAHVAYESLKDDRAESSDTELNDALKEQLEKSVDHLDLPEWLIKCLKGLDLQTIGQVLNASEEKIREAHYVGEVRSRYIKNEARSAVFEYLSG